MMRHAFVVFSLFVWGYFVAMQVWLLCQSLVAAVALHRDSRKQRFGRIQDMLVSDLAPPVSILVRAYNESAGIVESVRSMSMVSYPRFEIVVVNDGSTDDTLDKLISEFDLYPVPFPIRANLPTRPVRQVYRSHLPVALTVVDKENGGGADAINAAVNISRFPYVLVTDADVIIDGSALAHAMRMIAEDRERVVGVGGNIRPLNGSHLRHGHVVEPAVPEKILERFQLLEYVRSFVASRPAWSALNCLPLLSGAFAIYRRDVVVEVGGYTSGHFGEDLDMTMRMHRHLRESGSDYRIVYSPAAVAWTEVPSTLAVFRRQRIRWHRGLLTALGDFRSSLFNPRHGTIGMIGWPAMVLFEYLAPIIEFLGWIVVPLALLLGAYPVGALAGFFVMALLAGTITSLVALLLDERFGYFNHSGETLKLLTVVFVENLGLRQLTVWWRIRAMLGGRRTHSWGDMERRGVARVARPA